jgi:hypothetical protein
MDIREKIETVIKEKNKVGDNLSRDTQIILSYFGLTGIPNPTYESIGKFFEAGTRETVRQIIERKFTSKTTIEDFNILDEMAKFISKGEVHYVPDLIDYFINCNYISDGISIKGLMNLFHIFNLIEDFELYNVELDKVTAINQEDTSDIYLISQNTYVNLESKFRKIKTAPGILGVCEINEAIEKSEIRDNTDFIKSLILKTNNSWTYQKNEKLWYMFENRDNIIVNTLEKIINVASNIETDVLSNILLATISKRTSNLTLPTIEVIKAYLSNSKYIDIYNDFSYLKVNNGKLTDIEIDIIDYFKRNNKTIINYVEIKNHLIGKGYSKVYYDKCLYHSPFLYVDKSKGRTKYEFILLNHYSSKQEKNDNESTYIIFKSKLKALYGETDITTQLKMRKEQAILRDWLFKNKKYENCAICGKEFSITSLITAHKKKRSLCSEGERTDPNIVMPLCSFGCDVMYEQERVVIIDGVSNVVNFENLTQAEIEYLKMLDKRKIEEKWLHGNIDYFRKCNLTNCPSN